MVRLQSSLSRLATPQAKVTTCLAEIYASTKRDVCGSEISPTGQDVRPAALLPRGQDVLEVRPHMSKFPTALLRHPEYVPVQYFLPLSTDTEMITGYKGEREQSPWSDKERGMCPTQRFA